MASENQTIVTCRRDHYCPTVGRGTILEITEDQIVHDFALTREIAGEPKTSGIAIGDFGAGYSHFSGLRDLRGNI